MQILIIGTGYVGLVTGACFAEMGFSVTCLDIDEKKIALLQQGHIPIYEPGLQEIIHRASEASRIHFTTEYKPSVENADVIFLAVDTPYTESGTADLSRVQKALGSIGEYINDYKVIVNKSTVPVGTSHLSRQIIEKCLQERGLNIDFDVASNPEFLKEGSAVQDFLKPNRVVIGVDSQRAEKIMRELYKPFMLSTERLYVMDIPSAELTKYASNAMLATRISFMNWLSTFCEKTSADITQVRKGLGSDSRIGPHFLWAGCGWGGSCFPKDSFALEAMFKEHNLDASLIRAVININEEQKTLLFKKISTHFQPYGGLSGRKIALLGLSFKPDTDDMRDAPSLEVIRLLTEQNVTLTLYDPIAMENAKKFYPPSQQIVYAKNEYEAAKGCDAIVLITEWKQFRHLNFEKLLSLMNGNTFFDGRNQYDPESVAKSGFNYMSIGRNPAVSSLQTKEESIEYAETKK